MKTIVFRAKKPGDYIEAGLAPLNRSQEVRFGLVDVVLTVAILLCSCGLICLVLIR